jgi:hypothetical protein
MTNYSQNHKIPQFTVYRKWGRLARCGKRFPDTIMDFRVGFQAVPASNRTDSQKITSQVQGVISAKTSRREAMTLHFDQIDFAESASFAGADYSRAHGHASHDALIVVNAPTRHEFVEKADLMKAAFAGDRDAIRKLATMSDDPGEKRRWLRMRKGDAFLSLMYETTRTCEVLDDRERWLSEADSNGSFSAGNGHAILHGRS